MPKGLRALCRAERSARPRPVFFVVAKNIILGNFEHFWDFEKKRKFSNAQKISLKSRGTKIPKLFGLHLTSTFRIKK